jgi:cytochrome c biogenesis protein CcdA/thiol-disulfide isomerase/thioredoxin
MLLLLISFVAGVLTVLAPCILPLLPIIVGGSLDGAGVEKKKAVTVIASLGFSVIAFTFLLKVSSLFIGIPEYTWKVLSGGIVILIGVTFLLPALWENPFMARMSARSNILLGKGEQKKSFWGDVIVGAALGPVFSTCSPTYFIVLATVLPANPVLGTLYLLAYTLGLCLSLLLVAYAGQKLLNTLGVAADPHGLFKKSLGLIFILVGLAVLTGYDKSIESRIISSGVFDVTTVEHTLLEKQTMSDASAPAQISPAQASAKTMLPKPQNKALIYKLAPEISTPDGFINTDGKPITLAELRGKVVLLDIWTYSCINCQRTLPYLNDWYAKYKDQGLVIVGLHTPEFGFEKVLSNVEKAVEKFGIHYPVVLDNDYSTWQALGNQYWPRKYLIDPDGYIIYDHVGEGGYDETEQQIRDALKERNAGKVEGEISVPKNAVSVMPGGVQSPEVYFGSARNQYLSNGSSGVSGTQAFTLPTTYEQNHLYLGGAWNITTEYAETVGASSVVFPYEAKNVYMALGATSPMAIKVYRDDVLVKTVTVSGNDLYTLVEGVDYGKHELRIEIPKAGLQAFTFTFG